MRVRGGAKTNFYNAKKNFYNAFKEGSLNRVDRIRTFGPKVRILQHQKRGVTPRVLEIELIP